MAGTIRIIMRPGGTAPEWVREAWVGLELPCKFQRDERAPTELAEGTWTTPRMGCWHVPTKEALEILEREDPRAARWFIERGLLGIDNFTFAYDEAFRVSGDIPRQLVEPSCV